MFKGLFKKGEEISHRFYEKPAVNRLYYNTVPGGSQTRDLRLRRATLYSAELQAPAKLIILQTKKTAEKQPSF